MNYKFLTVTVLATTMGLFTSCEKDNDDNLFENIDELYVSATREANASRITISDLEAELASSQSEANDLTIDLASALSEVASLTASVAGLEGDNAALVADLADAKDNISALQTQEAVLMDTIDSLMEALQAAKAAAEVDADIIVALNTDLVVAIASQNDLQADLDAANATIASLVAQVADLQAQVNFVVVYNTIDSINGPSLVQGAEGTSYSIAVVTVFNDDGNTVPNITYTGTLSTANGMTFNQIYDDGIITGVFVNGFSTISVTIVSQNGEVYTKRIRLLGN